jgi:hypothetical protein
MDRQMVLDHLALAEQHIADGKIIIERQRSLVSELEQGGHDTTRAREFLSQFLQTQKTHEEKIENDFVENSRSWMLRGNE